jgi:cytochrome c556
VKRALFIPFILAAVTSSAAAQDHNMMNHSMPMSTAGEDSRQLVNFPSQMRQHFLANMRNHFGALSGILTALADGEYGKAGAIADARLGLDSPSAAACKAGSDKPDKRKMSGRTDMRQMMAQYMPDDMREFGLAMHQSASDFATVAARAAKSGDAKRTYAALARLSQQCEACHSAYRVR